MIDDGSTDRTVEVAHELGVDHVVSHPHNRGLAAAFMTGLDACLRAGATVIVNTDADNQYQGSSIPDLVAPVLSGDAEMVVGERPIETIDDFSRTKKLLQRLGSSVVRRFSGTGVRDAASGFRAYTRDAAMRVQVFGRYTYTMETIVQAGMERRRHHLRADRREPQDERIAPGQEHLALHLAVGAVDHPQLRPVQAVPVLLPHRPRPVRHRRAAPAAVARRCTSSRTTTRAGCRASSAESG